MSQKRVIGCWKLCAASLFSVSGAIAFLGDCTLAQIMPDATLPVNSIVTPSGNTSIIEGGTSLGGNLFHSFEEFSVPTGGTAFFNNALDIQNVFARVTGGSISNIDGIIRANGAANLFLLNSNGIIFGLNARIDIGGSFLASTANSMKFSDGAEFSAINPQTTSLLTVNVPIGLQMGASPGSIINQSRITDSNEKILGLSLLPGKSFGLIGGDITFDGGYLTVPQGRVVLASITDNSFVGITQTETGITFNYSDINNRRNLHLSQQATIDVSGSGGGEVQLLGGEISLTESAKITANTFGNQNGGDVVIQARKLTMQDDAAIVVSTFGEGNAGNVTVRATDLIDIAAGNNLAEFIQKIINGSLKNDDFRGGIFNMSFATGAAGSSMIETQNLIVRDGAIVFHPAFNDGIGGNLTINAAGDRVEIRDGALLSGTGGRGASGNLIINTSLLSVKNGGIVSTTTIGEGRGGNIAIDASDSLEMDGNNGTLVLINTPQSIVQFGIGSAVIISTTMSAASGGDLTINTRELRIKNSGQISTGTFWSGKSGELIVNAEDRVEFTGNPTPYTSFLATTTQSSGKAGNLTINTRQLIVGNGAQIQAVTWGSGKGGNITVNASELVELIGSSQGNSGLFVSGQDLAAEGMIVTGDAGNIRVNTERLIVREGARITASNLGVGKAGNVEIIAPLIQLDNQGAIRVTTTAGDRGNITIQSQNLQLRHESNITTDGSNTANGGNITINTDVLAALENSDIRANAIRGQGGNIRIDTFGDFRSFDSEIDASSQLGINGVVDIQTPDIDPTQGVVKFPQNFAPEEIPQNPCSARGQQIEFINIGRGGLPPNPREALNLGVVGTNESLILGRETSSNTDTAPMQIVEAQGWIINANGVVELTPSAPTVTPNNSGAVLPACN